MRVVVMNIDNDLVGVARRQVEQVKVTAVLIDQSAVVTGGPHHIEIGMSGYLYLFTAQQVMTPDIEACVPVGGVVDMVTLPYRPLVAAGPVSELLRPVAGEVIAPELCGTSSFVSFPGAELTINRGKAELRPVWREGGEPTVHDGEWFLKPAIDADGEVTAVTVTEAGAVCTEEDAVAVRCPVEHHMVEPAPGGHLTYGVVVGELACSPPLGGHHPYLSAA